MESAIYLTKLHLDNLINYAKSSPEKEICGLLLGDIVDGVTGIYKLKNFIPIRNISDDSYIEYIMEPNELLSVLKQTKHFDNNNELSIIGVFHNHPYWSPKPSIYDIEGAGYAGIYLIYSNKDDSIEAWFNEGSDDPNVTYALYKGEKKFGQSKIIII